MSWEEEQARHQRRMQLMRMQGEIERQELRNYIIFAVAMTLAAVAFACSALT